jgi:hypothetical protein
MSGLNNSASSGSSGLSGPPLPKRRNAKASPAAAAVVPPSPPPEQIKGAKAAPPASGSSGSGSSIHPWQSPAPAPPSQSAESAASAGRGTPAAAAAPPTASSLPWSIGSLPFADNVAPAAAADAAANTAADAAAEEAEAEEYFGVNGFPIADDDDSDYFADGDDIPAWQPSVDNIVYVQSQVEVIPESPKNSFEHTQRQINDVVHSQTAPALPLLPPSPPDGIDPTFGGDVKTRTTKVRLELLTPDQQAKRIHGTAAFDRVDGNTRCSLCGFKLSERQPPHKGAAAAAKIKWSYDHTLPVNLTALFFRCMFKDQHYNTAEIDIMCLLGDISCFNCNYSKGQKRFITIPRNSDASPNVEAINQFLYKLLNANHRQGNATLLVAINNISIEGNIDLKKTHWKNTQSDNIQRKVQKICDALNMYVDKTKAYAKLTANTSYINACQILAKTEQNIMKKSEEFKLIVASLGEGFPWKAAGTGTSPAINAVLAQLNNGDRNTIADANDRNCPFGVENSKIFKHFTETDTNAAVKAQKAKSAKEELIREKQAVVNAAEARVNAAQTEYDAAVAEAQVLKAPSKRLPGPKLQRRINAEKELAAAQAELAAAQAGRAAAAAAAPRRLRKTYGGVRHHRQRKTLKKRRVNKKATRRKVKRHTRRRT